MPAGSSRPGPRSATRTGSASGGNLTFHVRVRKQIKLDLDGVGKIFASKNGPLAASGKYITVVAKNSIKKSRELTRKKKKTGKISETPSMPGKPPRSRARSHPFKKFIMFAGPTGTFRQDRPGRGPYILVGAVLYPGRKTEGTAELHEKGGSADRKVRVDDGAYQRRKKRKGRKRHSKKSKEAIALWLASKTSQRTGLAGKLLGKKKRPGMGNFAMRKMTFPKRPYMVPAMERSKTKMSKFFRSSITS